MSKHIRVRPFILEGEYKPAPGAHPNLALCGATPASEWDLVPSSETDCTECKDDEEAQARALLSAARA